MNYKRILAIVILVLLSIIIVFTLAGGSKRKDVIEDIDRIVSSHEQYLKAYNNTSAKNRELEMRISKDLIRTFSEDIKEYYPELSSKDQKAVAQYAESKGYEISDFIDLSLYNSLK